MANLKSMSEYERIKATCLKNQELWEDPDFPATRSSVFYHQTPPFRFAWKRAKEIFRDGTFVLDISNPQSEVFDVVPGKLGDKWLVSCFGVLYICKGLFYRTVPADQTLDTNYAGIFRFRIWWCGSWVEVLVDDRLPTVNGKIAFLHCENSNQLWPSLLEKAYAKLHGSYEALKYGSVVDGLGDLTGGITDSVNTKTVGAEELRSLLETSSIVTASYEPSPSLMKVDSTEIPFKGVKNFRICELLQTETHEGLVNLVRLQLPSCMNKCSEFKDIMERLINDNEYGPLISKRDISYIKNYDDGIWLNFDTLDQMCPKIETVYLDAETSSAEITLDHCIKWQMKIYQSSWKRGVTAGGCRNHPDFCYINPQVLIELSEPDMVVVALNQHSVMEPKVIGFSIYKLSEPSDCRFDETFFRTNKSTINSHYMNSRIISKKCKLEKSAYLIMPTTFEPREEACFTLRVFSRKPIKMHVPDYTPARTNIVKLLGAATALQSNSFALYEAMFMQLADEHKTINAFELQDLLETCLPNDYIKSCSSIDTCRQIVLTLDVMGTGRISLASFSSLVRLLKHYQLIFKKHALEKMGIIRAERLRDALKDAGFIVTTQVLAQLVFRYMRKDGTLRFGDYVSAVMHLKRAFRVFEDYSQDSNTIQLNLTEWLSSTLN